MAKKKEELLDEARRLGLAVDEDMTNDDIEAVIEEENKKNLPDVRVRKFNPAERRRQLKKASGTDPNAPTDGSAADADGPQLGGGTGDAGASELNTGTTGTAAGATGTGRASR